MWPPTQLATFSGKVFLATFPGVATFLVVKGVGHPDHV